ncbi:hypothetical protein FYJ44_14175 [Desulfovibrio sp. PG-178-WT-4]|uniref:Uncharacterized protein n=1 Tax=Desulfovibrio porci TaxID=2605782 RepID=A0A6L5XPD3_9BACT|nr:hypothetical protein [Desulfovibrio porci]MSS29144.1 hypothetical protein [Desulfovibrio porci]
MRIFQILVLAFSLMALGAGFSTASAETVTEGSLEWYRLPENKDAREAKLAECEKLSREKQKADALCRNAKRANFLGEPYQKVKEPTYGF